MTLHDVMGILDAEVLVGHDHLSTDVKTAFSADLMSDVLAFAKPDSSDPIHPIRNFGSPLCERDSWLHQEIITSAGNQLKLIEVSLIRGDNGTGIII